MENLSVFSPVASASGNQFVGVARPAHFVRGPSRSRAVGAVCAWSAVFLLSSVPSCEYLRHCAVDLLCDAHDAHSAMAQENCPCHHSTIHFIAHGSGAGSVVLIRIA